MSFLQDGFSRSAGGWGVWLEGKTRVSFMVELQGQEDAGARVASGACVISVDSIAKWSKLLEWLELPHEPSIYISDARVWMVRS